MKYYLFLLVVLISGCKPDIKVSGIVVDRITKRALSNVLIRTIRDADASGIDFVETKSSNNGTFKLIFSSKNINSNAITLELSKEGFLTNTFSCFQDRPNDTFFLNRKY